MMLLPYFDPWGIMDREREVRKLLVRCYLLGQLCPRVIECIGRSGMFACTGVDGRKTR
jgi:hypothetical protein